MPDLTAKLIEIYQLGDEIAGVLDLPQELWPAPGQYLPAQRLSAEREILPTHLFQVIGNNAGLSIAPLPADWMPSDTLGLLNPRGHGFSLPETARRVALLALGVSPARLLTLAAPALAQDAAVALFCDPVPQADLLSRVPAIIEASPLSTFQDDLDWPDFLAVDLPLEELPRLDDMLLGVPLGFEGQALIRAAMPCHGLGECGVCSVKTRHGWRLACLDGPVFPLSEALNVAR